MQSLYKYVLLKIKHENKNIKKNHDGGKQMNYDVCIVLYFLEEF